MYYLDTEFTQSSTCVELLSIGIVDDDGREYYAQNVNADISNSNEFVTKNVLPLFDTLSWKTVEHIKQDILTFFTDDLKQGKLCTIWTWYGSYDWVALCGTIFGDMTNTPKGFPYSAFDLQQYAYHLGLRKIGIPKPTHIHHALADARWNRDAYQWLRRKELNLKK